MTQNRKFVWIVAAAVAVKLFLFVFAELRAPGAKFQIDSARYIKSGMNLAEHGRFASSVSPEGAVYEYYRLPGYPLFLGVLHKIFRLPFSVIVLIQVLLTLLAAYCVYRTALLVDPRMGFLSGLLILYDPPITVFSLLILTEALYLLLMALFAWGFVKYLRDRGTAAFFGAVVCLLLSIFVRPVGVYLILPVTGFVLAEGFLKKRFVKTVCLALAAFLILSAPVELWKGRNKKVYGRRVISSIDNATVNKYGLYRSYSRSDDPRVRETVPPVYYASIVLYSLSDLLIDPASLKYFGKGALRSAWRVFGYPWGAAWVIGFLTGLAVMPKNRYYWFFVMVSGYFILGTVWAVTTMVTPRFRVPVMPFAAVLTAYGWRWFWEEYKRRKVS